MEPYDGLDLKRNEENGLFVYKYLFMYIEGYIRWKIN